MQIRGTDCTTEGNQSFLSGLSAMVWCAIAKGKVVGPYFFEDENVNAENYRNMLIQYAYWRFASLGGGYIFHHDGAPPHYSSQNVFEQQKAE